MGRGAWWATVHRVAKRRTPLKQFSMHCMACRILVPQPGIEPVPPAIGVQSPNHWTHREFLARGFFDILVGKGLSEWGTKYDLKDDLKV